VGTEVDSDRVIPIAFTEAQAGRPGDACVGDVDIHLTELALGEVDQITDAGG
jgi:hypothetical protein